MRTTPTMPVFTVRLFGYRLTVTNEKAKPKTWSRKGRCPGCNVVTGSRHARNCSYNYAALHSGNHATR